MAHVLLIDDETRPWSPSRCVTRFPARGTVSTSSAREWTASRRFGPSRRTSFSWTCICPTSPGFSVYQQIRQIDGRIPVIFITLAKSADAAIDAMKQGAYDYLFKPLDLSQLKHVVGEALEVARRMREPAVLAEAAHDGDADGAIIGSCPAMHKVYKSIGRVAAQDVPGLDHRRERHR